MTTNPTTTALVTGANKGLGRETVRRLGELGWTVWLGSRDLDVADEESVQTAADQVAATHDHLDVLVTCSVRSG